MSSNLILFENDAPDCGLEPIRGQAALFIPIDQAEIKLFFSSGIPETKFFLEKKKNKEKKIQMENLFLSMNASV